MRKTMHPSSCGLLCGMLFWSAAVLTPAGAAPPQPYGGPQPDYEASGFVVPAGAPPLSARPGVAPVGYNQPLPPGLAPGMMGGPGAPGGMPPGMHPEMMGGPGAMGPMGHSPMGTGAMGPGPMGPGVSPAGYQGPVEYAPAPDGYPPYGHEEHGGYYGSDYGGDYCGDCGGHGCGLGCGSLLRRWLHGGGLHGPSCIDHLCLFCQGHGCGACPGVLRGRLLGGLAMLGPYTEAGLGSQRWYDLSAEVLLLNRRTSGGGRMDLVTQGIGGPVVLATDDLDIDGVQPGMRLSAAFLFGVGGNIEVTYMGLNEWEDSGRVFGTDDLYTVISEFGTTPFGGFGDTDELSRVDASFISRFHSGEVNYRRRWVGPYQRFQGSWLVGLRHIDIDETIRFGGRDSTGVNFFDSRFDIRNAMTGPQVGGDLWWNVFPGINTGIGWKTALMRNRTQAETNLEATTVPEFRLVDTDYRTTMLNEFTAEAVYRFSYSWSFRTAYHVMALNRVALGQSNFDTSPFTEELGGPAAAAWRVDNRDRLTLHGFSFGAEYLW